MLGKHQLQLQREPAGCCQQTRLERIILGMLLRFQAAALGREKRRDQAEGDAGNAYPGSCWCVKQQRVVARETAWSSTRCPKCVQPREILSWGEE